MRDIELLAPAGSAEGAKAVINAGADAIYIGGSRFGARAYAKNPEEESLIDVIEYAHIHGSRVYLTINTLLKNSELNEDFYNFLLPYYNAGLDGVIVQDLGVMSFVKRHFAELPIHCSTQMTISDISGARLMKEAGADRVVLSRELSLSEIKDITDAGIETECFIHGALCYCYSGQCLMSSVLGGRSGNRGRCAQPCRLAYEVEGKKKYILSPKDLCTIEHLPKLMEAGIYSYKIEGRMKRAEYAAAVTSVYRKYFDMAKERGLEGYEVSKEDMDILLGAGNRKGFTPGYYYFHNGAEMISYDKPDYDTAGEDFFADIRKRYIEKPIKENLNGFINLHKGKEAELRLEYRGKDYIFRGDVVSEAINAPLSEEKVLKQMNKTGDTPFEFVELKADTDNDIFMPVNQLNSLRREALEGLKKEILKDFYPKVSAKGYSPYQSLSKADERGKRRKGLYVYIESARLLDIVLEEEDVSRIYVNASCFALPGETESLAKAAERIIDKGIEAFYALPHILRKDIRRLLDEAWDIIEESFDGILIRNIDELGFVCSKAYKGLLAGDYSLYAFNREAYGFIKRLCDKHNMNLESICAPIELNSKELAGVRGTYDEIVSYGYLPLMISTQCVRNTTKGCDKKNSLTFIKDRYKKDFGVRAFCNFCYSVVYNSLPLFLQDKESEIKKADIGNMRINLTYETPYEAKKIFMIYKGERELEGDFTRGHFSRGVE